MISRKQERAASAQYLNGLSRAELFRRFSITRTARIDTLDSIGVPVYSCVRPAARTISVSAGKASVRHLARAGAIAEAIEFHTFEHPLGPWIIGKYPGELPLSKNSTWTPDTPVPLESVTHYASGRQAMLPSDLIWLVNRHGKEQYFQRGSNGQAVGASFEDALVQGLCECVERDQLTLRRLSMERLDLYPPLIDLSSAPESIAELQSKCEQASLTLALFYCVGDIPVPAYWALLMDPSNTSVSVSGWGAHVTHKEAATRAILEAIQSRAVYIAGARDDITRHSFAAMKERPIKELIAEMASHPRHRFPDDCVMRGRTAHDELRYLLMALKDWRDNIYYLDINLGDLHAVKTIVLGLEQPMFSDWREMRWSKLYADHLRGPESVRMPAGTLAG